MPSFFSKKTIHLFLFACVSLTVTSTLLAEFHTNEIGQPVLINEVSWQRLELLTENGSCKASFPGVFISLEDYFDDFEEEVKNPDYIASEFQGTLYSIFITDSLNEISTAEELVELIGADEDKDKEDGFFDESELLSIRILTNLPANILYGVELSLTCDNILEVSRLYKSTSGKSYIQMVSGENPLLEFFNTFEVTP